jgi:alkyl sulfatase BDS1-like metallo-beta-lactamase superfamily hydrolase
MNIDDTFLNNLSIDTLFNVLSVRFKPEDHDGSLYKVCFNFSSGLVRSITLRNGVAVISNEAQNNCDLEVLTQEIELKRVLTGLKNPVSSISSGEIVVQGGNTEFLKFLAIFR